MSLDYDEITASHYAAFRPELHRAVLSACLDQEVNYNNGLDIGCGTGHSSIALTAHCKKVVGLEPSEAMLENALIHPRLKYLYFNGTDIPFKKEHFDIITFAGSLYYAKSQELLNEVIRVSTTSAKIVVYDFEVILQSILTEFNLQVPEEIPDYNHKEDFSGLEQGVLKLVKKQQEKTLITIEAEQLAHLLLASKKQYEVLKELLGRDNVFDKTLRRLRGVSDDRYFDIPVDLYYTIYAYLKD